ncbi:MAG TPA: efflux RND transporter periplasmic adaptor subunit, partial [Candidatus Paceibacterota bacterium]|nr:efflux RND transporter periplasmic adaptor subunit [Candidatus Paceibacterota bacterium]
KSQVQLLENQIRDATLKSPTKGQIIKINKKSGEMTQLALQEAVIALLPVTPFEVEVDIYEEDVVKIAVGNSVDISLVAFSGRTFMGKIISISPAEKMVDGVVYYETIIGFEKTPEGIKSGMSADIVIKAQTKENVLILPDAAIRTRDSRNFVEILVDGKIQEKDIEVGLRGSNDMVEIVSGLEQGEKVILR